MGLLLRQGAALDVAIMQRLDRQNDELRIANRHLKDQNELLVDMLAKQLGQAEYQSRVLFAILGSLTSTNAAAPPAVIPQQGT